MDKDVQSISDLTEFPRLSPEDKSNFGLSGFSKFFTFGRGNESPETENAVEKSEEKGGDDWEKESQSETASVESLPSLTSEGRTLPNVLKRISNLVALKNVGLTSYAKSELKQYWMPDSFSNECYECGEKFSAFRRRHHCRVCGQIFCSRCCQQHIPGKIMGCTGDLRVCTYCCKVVLSYLESADMTADLSSDLRALQEDLQVKLARGGEGQQSGGAVTSEEAPPKRKASLGYQEERFALGKAPNCTVLSEEERCRALQNSSSLRGLFEEIARPATGVILQTYRQRLRVVPGCFTGNDLVEWLIAHSKAATRVQALAIGQMLLEAGYLEPFSELSFTDGVSLYRLVLELIGGQQAGNALGGASTSIPERLSSEGEDESELPHSGSSYLLNMNVEDRVVHVVRPSPPPDTDPDPTRRKKTSVAHELEAEGSVFLDAPLEADNKEVVLKTGWHRASALVRPLYDEAKAYHSLSAAYENHRSILLSQLLSSVGLSKSWAEVVVPLAEAIVDKVRPDVTLDDEMDIRQYVQIKKLPEGRKEECRIVPAVVCSKNVAHRAMRIRISDPRILLLRCAVVYQRVEGRLLSLEPVMMQEEEYLRHVVARIAFLKPDVVLVYKNVSRLAQEHLLRLGITLVLNVKLRTLDRVARFTGADIVSSVDPQISKPQLGTCKTFHLTGFQTENGSRKTLMFFEGPRRPEVGCTLLLRGGSPSELAKLKKIASFLVLLEFNWRMEKSFLMDEFAMPPSISEDLFPDCQQVTTEKTKMLPKTEKIAAERQLISDESDPLHAAWEAPSPPPPPPDPPRLNKFRAALEGTVLSISPFLKVALPYLETDQGHTCPLRAHFPRDIFYSRLFADRVGSKDTKTVLCRTPICRPRYLDPPHPFLTEKFTEDASSEKVQTLLALFRANGGQRPLAPREGSARPLKVTENVKPVDALDPYEHQRFAVLFCSYSTYSENAPAFCIDPWIVKMYFYGPDDIPLGCFLENYCFRPSFSCLSQTCHAPMLQHVRRFVHDPGALCLSLNRLPRALESPGIWMWNWCSQCKQASPMVPMSDDTWSLSFAKYLELRFRGEIYLRRATTACRHNLHHEHYQYFARGNLVAAFKFSPIRVRWEVSLPPPLIAVVAPENAHSVAVDELRTVSIKGHDVYSMVLQQIISLNVSEDEMEVLKAEQQRDQAAFKARIEELQYRLTSPTLETKLFDPAAVERDVGLLWRVDDGICGLKRHVCEVVAAWNARLLDVKRSDAKRASDGNVRAHVTPPPSEDGKYKEEDELSSVCDGDDTPAWYKSSESLDVPESEDNISFTSQQDEARASEELAREKRASQDEAPDGKADKKTVKALLSQILASTKDSGPVQCPWGPTEHYRLPPGLVARVPVIESEPSSIISYALASVDYQKFLEEAKSSHSAASDKNSPSALHRRKTPSVTTSEKDEPVLPSSHIEISFSDATANFSCHVYFAEDFASLRALVFPSGEEAFARSLAHCFQWAARGGKSGSHFCKTRDERFVLKQMTKLELQLFLELAPHYVSYVKKCHELQQPTLLGKIVGVYTVVCKNSSGSASKSTLLVMENLFYQRSVTQKYDLKGSVRNRLVNPAGEVGSEIVYLDENLLKMTCDSPLYILPHSQTVLMKAIESDTEFLAAQDVMDYSLLVGLDESSSELVVGIIDYVRTFTWDKRLENMVKKSVTLGHPAKQPTIIQPKDYRVRFIAAMKRYFLPVPDRWYDLENRTAS